MCWDLLWLYDCLLRWLYFSFLAFWIAFFSYYVKINGKYLWPKILNSQTNSFILPSFLVISQCHKETNIPPFHECPLLHFGHIYSFPSSCPSTDTCKMKSRKLNFALLVWKYRHHFGFLWHVLFKLNTDQLQLLLSRSNFRFFSSFFFDGVTFLFYFLSIAYRDAHKSLDFLAMSNVILNISDVILL